jgi:hypothetical protein
MGLPVPAALTDVEANTKKHMQGQRMQFILSLQHAMATALAC